MGWIKLSIYNFKDQMFYVGAMIAPLVNLWLIHKYTLNVPLWDEWGLVPTIENAYRGKLDISQLWQQHNEHRLTTVKIIIISCALLTKYNVVTQAYVAWGISLASVILLRKILFITLNPSRNSLIAPLTFAISLLMFTVMPYGHLSYLQYPILKFCVIFTAWSLARFNCSWKTVFACLMTTVVGGLTMASGLLLWCSGLIGFLLQHFLKPRNSNLQILIMAGVIISFGAGFTAIYFIGWKPVAQHSDVSRAVTNPLQFAAFIFGYLGAPWTQGRSHNSAVIFGASGVITLVSAYFLVARRVPELLTTILPWVTIASFIILVAAATSVGRVQHGLDAALAQRYLNVSLPFWSATFVVVALTIHKARKVIKYSVCSQVALSSLLGVLVLIYGRASVKGYRIIDARYRNREIALVELYRDIESGSLIDGKQSLLPLSHRIEFVRANARLLKNLQVGPFSPNIRDKVNQFSKVDTTQINCVLDVEGELQAADCDKIWGWAWNRKHPEQSVRVGIYDGGQKIATVTARWFRSDLLSNGKGNGYHAFFWKLPSRLMDKNIHFLHARVDGSDRDLPGGVKLLKCDSQFKQSYAFPFDQ